MMTPVERQLLEEVRAGVADIATRLTRIEERNDVRGKHVADLEVRVRALEERVTRLMVGASIIGGAVGALAGALMKSALG